MHKSQEKEVVVVGGGMIGAALALGFAQQNRQVVLVEKQATDFTFSDVPDNRVSAISHGSIKLLQSLGVWSDPLAIKAEPYHQLETWEWDCAKVSFTADSLGLSQLGFMVENRRLQQAIWQQLQQYDNVEWKIGQSISAIKAVQSGCQLQLQGETSSTLVANLLCGCDGAQSMVRKLAMIGSTHWQYRQGCLLITVTGQQLEKGVTWQQFMPSGPKAYLPLAGDWACLVWYDSMARIRQLSQLSMPQLAEQIAQQFPARLPKVTPVQAAAFPLARQHCQQYSKPHLALVGDAAHTINPLAGQGVNLGYRDVGCLLGLLQDKAMDNSENLTDALQRYQQQRYRDNHLMQSAMDLFYASFSQPWAMTKVMRNLGLMAAQQLPFAKRQVLRYALGSW